jgi:hypothetical protein
MPLPAGTRLGNIEIVGPLGSEVSSATEFANSLGTDGKTFTITGELAYQACHSKTCFLPTSAPIQWQLSKGEGLSRDRERALC